MKKNVIVDYYSAHKIHKTAQKVESLAKMMKAKIINKVCVRQCQGV
jgi:hypothetical protein